MQTIVSIPKVGPFDFSITNAVIYMWVSAVVVFLFFFIVSQEDAQEPGPTADDRRDLSSSPPVTLPARSGRRARSTTTSSSPSSLHPRDQPHRPDPKPFALKAYTPTTNINVTFGMAIVVFFMTQFQGVKQHGVRRLHALLADARRACPRLSAIPLNGIFFVGAHHGRDLQARCRSPSDFSATPSPGT